MLELTMVFDEILKTSGFEKKKKSWYRELEEVNQIVNLQKSDFGEQYYLNLGIQPSSMAKKRFEPENKYPLRLRFDGEMFGNKSLPKIIDLADSRRPESIQVEEVKSMLRSSLQFLDRVKTISGLKSEITANPRILNRTVAELRVFLNI